MGGLCLFDKKSLATVDEHPKLLTTTISSRLSITSLISTLNGR